jgi:hypothetical protein
MEVKRLSPKSYLKKKVFDDVSNMQKKKKSKISDTDFRVLELGEHDSLLINQYKVSQLKEMCSKHNLKKTGNKDELLNRLFNYLKFSLYATTIQRVCRGILVRLFLKCSGLRMKNNNSCTNDSDFATLEPLKEIPYNQFFSFKDEENNIYGCDVISFNGLLKKTSSLSLQQNENNLPLNPYNRTKITTKIINNYNYYLKLAKILKIRVITQNEEDVIDPKKLLELKVIELFQYINELGNYADSDWLLKLPRHMLVLFIREVYDIWHYRAQITQQTMREIVPPHGNPFVGLQLHLAQNQTDDSLMKNAVRIIGFLVKSASTRDNRSLGAYYVLAALTLVSQEARNSLPWLYQSVAH